jgi:hypothetical protein
MQSERCHDARAPRIDQGHRQGCTAYSFQRGDVECQCGILPQAALMNTLILLALQASMVFAASSFYPFIYC